MKVSNLNFFNSLNFGSKNDEEGKNIQDAALVQVNDKGTNNKSKVIAYSLSGLAAVGLAAVLINNVRCGKVKTPTGETPIKPVSEAIDGAGSKLTEEAQKALDAVKAKLDPKKNPVIDADFIDRQFPQSLTPDNNWELYSLNRQLAKEERFSEKVKAKGQKLVSDLEAFERRVDPNLGVKTDAEMEAKLMPKKTRKKMQKFYTEMAEKAEAEAKIAAERQAKYEAMMKLKEENPQEYAGLKAERAKAQRLEKQQKKAEVLAKNTKVVELQDGTKVKRVVEKTNTEVITRDYSIDNDKLVREVRVEKNKTIHTVYDENSKITFIKDKNGNSVQKVFEKNDKGQYELKSREVYNKNDLQSKTVTRLKDGNTEIVVENIDKKVITIRDKKGNVISEEVIDKKHPPKGPQPPEPQTVKVLDPWYIEYMNLCKEFGVSVRPCGKGGAWNHYYELRLKKYDPEAYESYLRLEEYRSRYDEKAMLRRLLDKIDNNSIYAQHLTKEQVAMLKAYIATADLDENTLNKIQKIIQIAEEAILERAVAAERAAAERARQTQTVHQPQVLVYA